jgi:hypothetical protein
VQLSVPSSSWEAIASSAAGTKLVAAANMGGIWTSLPGVYVGIASTSKSTTLGASGSLQGYFGTVVELIYAGGGQFITLYQNGPLWGQ